MADFNSFDLEVLRQMGYLGAESLSLAQRVGHQIIEISKFCKDGTYKLSGLNIDPINGIVFPVFSNDNLETIVNRYIKLYPSESKIILKDFVNKTKDNESGWSKKKLMKFDCTIPVRIKNACNWLAPDFWEVDGGKNVDRFKVLCPKLATKRRNL